MRPRPSHRSGGSRDHSADRTHHHDPPSRSRAATVALWALQVVLALVFAFSSFGKLSFDPATVTGFQAMGLGNPGMITIGILEALAVIGLLVPRLVALTAWCLVALMLGAVLATALVGGGPLIAVPAAVLVLVASLAWARRREITATVAVYA